jgi:two-component system, NarL family, response regulator NreC
MLPGMVHAESAGSDAMLEDAESATTVTVVIADDHAVVRRGLRHLLEAQEGFDIVAEAANLNDARRYVRGHRPDVLVLDVKLPEGSSLTSIPAIRRESPETQIVVLTMQKEPDYARQALISGALGYVLKEAAEAELVEAIRRAAAGDRYLNPRLGARLAGELPPPPPPDHLSEREVEVLRMIALGHTNAEIADELCISVRTVEIHRAHIQRKARLSSRAGLVRYALDHKLIEADVGR